MAIAENTMDRASAIRKWLMKKAASPVKLYVIDSMVLVSVLTVSVTFVMIFSRNFPKKLFKTMGRAININVVMNPLNPI